ncbi:MAG: hypothetical protein ACPL4K_01510, partial [Candidatus Margulisiibacteriota bacterium]
QSKLLKILRVILENISKKFWRYDHCSVDFGFGNFSYHSCVYVNLYRTISTTKIPAVWAVI